MSWQSMPLSIATAVWLALMGGPAVGLAQRTAVADVVVVVDTSASMARQGMDPERTSLLVAKLLADIVPGNLAIVRSLDLSVDRQLLPSRDTGQTVPCSEDPNRQCHHVEAASDWYKDARDKRFGALMRTARGDAAFKEKLDSHLAQVINNSLFGLGFRAAQGTFDSHGSTSIPRTVVWLSDGQADDGANLGQVIQELKGSDVDLEAVVFGRGSTTLPANLGLHTSQARNPAELMKAFAGAFRRMVQAPYEVDGVVANAPTFEMKPKVDEAWIVVYGDETLREAMIDTPEGPKRADYAQDRHAGAGAYCVLYVQNPKPGRWGVRATGGGVGVAYAVVQRSALSPVLLEPASATAGQPVALVAGLTAGGSATLGAADLPDDLEMEAQVEGRTVRLVDDGTGGDAVARDGRFTAMVTFETIGDAEVVVRARSALLDKIVRRKIPVVGVFRFRGAPLEIDLGAFSAPGEACRDVTVAAEHIGAVPFDLKAERRPPSGHTFELRQARGTLRPGRPPVPIAPGETLRLCLVASSRAPSSSAAGEHWLDLVVAGSRDADARVPLRLRWNLRGLTWWQRWRWLILSILTVLVGLLIIYGWIRPRRFPRNLAVTFVPERDELEEQSPQPVAQWRGVGIGWYRDAHAYLHPNFRLSGIAREALAGLFAIPGGTETRPCGGYVIYRETLDGDWENVQSKGSRNAAGQVYRVGENGPYFRVSVRKV